MDSRPAEEPETAQCFAKVSCALDMHLPPFFMGRMLDGVRLKLNRMLLRYFEPLEGVLLLYENVRLLCNENGGKEDRMGRIIDDTPHIHFRVAFDAIVFQPGRNTWLVGEVTHVGASALSLQLFGYFRAQLALDEMGGNGEQDWVVREASSTSASVGIGMGSAGLSSDSGFVGRVGADSGALYNNDSGLEWASTVHEGHVITRGTRLRFRSLGFTTDKAGILVTGSRFTLQEELDYLEARHEEKRARRQSREMRGVPVADSTRRVTFGGHHVRQFGGSDDENVLLDGAGVPIPAATHHGDNTLPVTDDDRDLPAQRKKSKKDKNHSGGESSSHSKKRKHREEKKSASNTASAEADGSESALTVEASAGQDTISSKKAKKEKSSKKSKKKRRTTESDRRVF